MMFIRLSAICIDHSWKFNILLFVKDKIVILATSMINFDRCSIKVHSPSQYTTDTVSLE